MRCCGLYKFFSGFFAAAALASWYLASYDVVIPFMGYTITPHIEAIKAVVFGVLFVLFFYLGFLKRKDTTCCK